MSTQRPATRTSGTEASAGRTTSRARRLYRAVGIVAAAMLAFGGSSRAQAGPTSPRISTAPAIVPSEFNGDLRKLPQAFTPVERLKIHRPLELEYPYSRNHKKTALPGAPKAPSVPAPVAPMAGPDLTFTAMDYDTNGAGWPPDTVGDVGPDYFVEAVNTSIGVYTKSGSAAATVTFNAFWDGTGTPCDNANQGDPTVVYDPGYRRFIIADFAWDNIKDGPYYECIAVSKTSDPVTGGFWLYALRADDASHPWLPDYPKMGIWPDGLYLTANMFDCADTYCSSASYEEVRVFALELSTMVNGATTPVVTVDMNSNTANFSLLPSNYRGLTPPAGAPNYLVEESQSVFAWEVFKFHPNYTTPGSSTFTGPTLVTQTSYGLATATVPEPSPGEAVDTLYDRLMMQNQYRRIDGVESLWVNHTTGTSGSATSPTSVQWAQIDVTGSTVQTSPVQQQIYKNGSDTLDRFMGSLAVDHQGDMALGFSATNASTAPDIRYAGRLSTDALNGLPRTEVTMLPTVTRYVQSGGYNRWGDYSAMNTDVDQCTFWYVNMFYPANGSNWTTRIGTFKFPECAPAIFIDGFEFLGLDGWSSSTP